MTQYAVRKELEDTIFFCSGIPATKISYTKIKIPHITVEVQSVNKILVSHKNKKPIICRSAYEAK